MAGVAADHTQLVADGRHPPFDGGAVADFDGTVEQNRLGSRFHLGPRGKSTDEGASLNAAEGVDGWRIGQHRNQLLGHWPEQQSQQQDENRRKGNHQSLVGSRVRGGWYRSVHAVVMEEK